ACAPASARWTNSMATRSDGTRLRRVTLVEDAVPPGPAVEWDAPLFRTALAQFRQALPFADVSTAVATRLSAPERSTIVSVPVRLDDGEWVVLPGYRVQHSSVLGPTKGGIRYDD